MKTMIIDSETPHRCPVKGQNGYQNQKNNIQQAHNVQQTHRIKYAYGIGAIILMYIIGFIHVANCADSQLANAPLVNQYSVISNDAAENEEITEIKEVNSVYLPHKLNQMHSYYMLEDINEEVIADEMYQNLISVSPLMEVVIPSAITTTNTSTTTITETTPIKSTTTNSLTATNIVNLQKTDVAEQIWLIMQEYGWSDIISAGILGNMMAEVGGHTLDLKWDTYAKGYYGLCMWSLKYFPDIAGLNIEEQLEYLKNTLDLTMFDRCKTPAEAALVFAKQYEKCSSRSYKKRQSNAEAVFKIFA